MYKWQSFELFLLLFHQQYWLHIDSYRFKKKILYKQKQQQILQYSILHILQVFLWIILVNIYIKYLYLKYMK